MKKNIWLPILLFFFLLINPTKSFAIDFQITTANIDAFLESDGDVKVVEKFVYDFDDRFNGITREIIPIKGAAIVDFAAFENGNPLKVEQDDDLYKIYRAGEYEKIEIELNYTIKNGMKKYQDGVQFYWPFFDNRNETPYESMTITIHPPKETTNVLAVGYDTAYKKEIIHPNGSVQFIMGSVPDGKNGDIRVVYPTEIFTGMKTNSGNIRPEILSDIEKMAEKEARFQANKETWEKIGQVFIPFISLFFIGLLAVTLIPSFLRNNVILKDLERRSFYVPEEKLSLPATVLFTRGVLTNDEGLAVALADLIRKGKIRQEEEGSFVLIDRSVEFEHERLVIDFLFDKVGDGQTFSLRKMKTYPTKSNNYNTYVDFLNNWKYAVKNEIREATLYKSLTAFRLILAVIAIILLITTIIFGIYHHASYMIISMVGIIMAVGFAVFYRPKTDKGLEIYWEWITFSKRLEKTNSNQWKSLSRSEKERSLVYAITLKEKFKKNLRNLVESTPNEDLSYSYSFHPWLIYSMFNYADTHSYHSTTSSSSSFSGGGGGFGGGGGGSGAF